MRIWENRMLATDSSTIGQKIVARKGHATGFDLLRIVLAIAVLCWHSISFSYGRGPDIAIWTGPFRAFPALILPMFFALSGFLVAGSLFRCRSLAEFFALRVLRIVPALFVEVCLSALLLGPLVTDLPWSRYFSGKDFYWYWFNIVGYIHYYLPGVFEANPISRLVNVSLWTVPFELDCYILLGLLAVMAVVKKPVKLFLIFVAASATFPWIEHHRHHGWIWTWPSGLLLVLSFLAGLLLYVLRDHIPLHRRLFVLSIVISILAMCRPDTSYLAPLPVAYITVYIGLLNAPRVPILMSGDYSYGVYLYACPMQQTFAWAFPSDRVWWLNILFALPASLVWAAISWHLIEKPVLNRKRALTSLIGQGVATAAERVGALAHRSERGKGAAPREPS